MNTQSSMRDGGLPLDTMYMGKESLSRRRSQEQRERRESKTRRQDSQGRVFLEDLIDPTVGMEGHSLRMEEQEDSTGNG